MTDASRVRSFNRAVTRRIGVLSDDFLGRNRPLGESRFLYEVGPEGVDLKELRARLGLDSGYASRLVASLEKAGLVTTVPSTTDRRVRRVSLTAEGEAEVTELDRRSDEAATELLGRLNDRQQERLLDAMTTVERLLRAATVEVAPVAADDPRALWCLEQYYAELRERFEEGFDLSAAIPVETEELTPPRGVFLLATSDGESVGCGCLKRLEPGVGYLKRMWIGRAARGMGLGRQMLEALERWAFAHDYKVIRLETNRALEEAQTLYRSAGYREIQPFIDEPYGDFWFEKRLRG